jgi:hypothetical protein
MGNLKNELFFHFNTKDWDVSHYASEKYKLTLENQYPEIKFVLSDTEDVFLSGSAKNSSPLIDFTFDKKSQWLKNQKIEKYKIVELMEHLFLFMEVQGEYR